MTTDPEDTPGDGDNEAPRGPVDTCPEFGDQAFGN
jgi:hypothetical protein